MHEELGPRGLAIVAIALDRSAGDVREFADAAGATFPILIDAEHRTADLYRIINVPTGVWIDESGRIVRPPDVAFGNNAFTELHGVDAAPHLGDLRAWATEGRLPFDERAVRERQIAPTAEEQLARAEFALGWWLHSRGRAAAAEPHFARADALAPHDFTIRRGSMPIRGKDPFGGDFAELFQEWIAAGKPYYGSKS
jgi:hypothetical protein